jgi:hypothetical protein
MLPLPLILRKAKASYSVILSEAKDLSSISKNFLNLSPAKHLSGRRYSLFPQTVSS